MWQVAGLVLPLFGLIVLGWVAGRLKPLPLDGLAWLNFFILYLALPALFFRLLARTPVEEFSNAAFLLSTTLATFIVFAACFVIALIVRRGDIRVATIQGFAGAYGNIGYMGPPLAIAAFGPEAGVPVALVFCLDNAMHFTLAPLLMAVGSRRRKAGGEGGARKVGEEEPDEPDAAEASLMTVLGGIARRILTHPFIIATIAGMLAAASEWQPSDALDALLLALANAAAPCALFAMGVTAALRPLRRVPLELAWLIPIKLVVHPLVVYLLVSRLPGIEPVWLHAAVLLAALPSATNVFVLAQQYGVWQERASSAVVLSTLFSIVTVTSYIYLVKTGVL